MESQRFFHLSCAFMSERRLSFLFLMWKLCIINLSILNGSVTAKRDDILRNLYDRPWISNNDLKIAIDLSFPFSQCCNVVIEGNTYGTDDIFNQFREVYQHNYYIRHQSFGCNGYFLLASSCKMIEVLPEIPSLSTIELLIIIDNEESNCSELLNATLYGYANVNIVTKSGMWILSENSLFPRSFNKITKFEEMKHQNGIINLQGRQLQGAAFYNPPFCYLSTSINKTVNGIEGEIFIARNEAELDGVEMQLFLIMAQRLNFTWMIRKPNNNYRYGRKNGSDWNGGMIGQIFRKEIDIAFSGIWLKEDHYQFVNLSTPWYQLFIHFLVPRPKPRTSFWALTRPLSIEVWLAVITTIIIQSLNVHFKARINNNIPTRFKSYINTLTELITRLVGIWAPKQTHGLRLQLHLWHIAGLLIVTAYCSSLASRLTTPDYEDRIDTTEQFIEANLSWGREGPIPKFDDYFNLNDTYEQHFPERFQTEHSSEERHQKIMNGNYAIVGRIVHSIFFPENEIQNLDLENYRVMKAPVNSYYVSFATQPWLLRSVDTVNLAYSLFGIMLWMKETGLIKYHLGNVIHRRTSYSLRNVLIEYDVTNYGPRALMLKPLGAGFLLLFVGLMIATIAFCHELKSGFAGGNVLKTPHRVE